MVPSQALTQRLPGLAYLLGDRKGRAAKHLKRPHPVPLFSIQSGHLGTTRVELRSGNWEEPSAPEMWQWDVLLSFPDMPRGADEISNSTSRVCPGCDEMR
jgi:hypothetical protein